MRERERARVCRVYDTTVRCVWELIMQYNAVLQRSLHGYRLQVAPLREGTEYCEKEVCADGQLDSGLAGCSPSVDRKVGEGGAQRLLARIGHVGAVLEEHEGESGEASQLAQPLVRDVVTHR
jgi:hypothetical protein